MLRISELTHFHFHIIPSYKIELTDVSDNAFFRMISDKLTTYERDNAEHRMIKQFLRHKRMMCRCWYNIFFTLSYSQPLRL